jgi:hypothetical protein
VCTHKCLTKRVRGRRILVVPTIVGSDLDPFVSCYYRHEKLPACLNMASEVVQNSLPPVSLLFERMSWLTIERYMHPNAFRDISELDLRRPITEGIVDQFVLHNICINSGEIKPHAAILCLHS